jgi:hypothetical protein
VDDVHAFLGRGKTTRCHLPRTHKAQAKQNFLALTVQIDDNGRMGRFLMKVMLASGGYPWTVIELERRSEYMAALDEASSRGNIVPFAESVASKHASRG